jgi:hypothetical protein
VDLFVDTHPLTVNIYQPTANSVFRNTVTVGATPNEPVQSVDFVITGVAPTTDSSSPYQAVFSLATAPEGNVTITATAHGMAGETATSTVQIRVDRTPPAIPDVTKITAAGPVLGTSLIIGSPSAVEGLAAVLIDNLDNAQHAECTAAADGHFSTSMLASSGDRLRIVARDSMLNASAPAQVLVAPPPPLPPSSGETRLLFVGQLGDRVGPGQAALTSDGLTDAVFTLSLATGDVTRLISYVDLQGPGSMTRSTRAAAGSVLGLAIDATSPFLNAATGEVSFPITGGTTLTLLAADAGFIVPGTTYTATAVFTDGSRFVGTYTLVSPDDQLLVPHGATIVADHPTVTGTAAAPGTAVLTLSDIRDIEGVLVPDGTKIALAVADMASKDPIGNPIRSAGGTITNGDPAANNPSFKVFTILGGQVSATYSSAPVDPAAALGALSVVQVLAADAGGNVLGQEAVATFDLNLKRPTDRALISLSTPSLYADKTDRRVPVHIELRDASGNLQTGTTHVLVSASSSASTVGNGASVDSKGGRIVGGATSPSGVKYRWFTTTTGIIDCEYSTQDPTQTAALTAWLDVGQTAAAVISVVDATATGSWSSQAARGLATLTLTGPAGAEVSLSPESVPIVYPPRLAQVRVHHVRDTRANRLPDGARLLLTAANSSSTTVTGAAVTSAGGTILDGLPSPTNAKYKYQPLVDGQIVASYSHEGISPANPAPGTALSAMIQLLMGDGAGTKLSDKAIALKVLRVLASSNAVGDASPPSVLADGGLHTSTVTFDPVVDAWGDYLPDGSKVLVSAASGAGANAAGGGIVSDGGAILNGDPSPSSTATIQYRVLTVTDGAVTASYSDQGLTSAPGQTKTARVVMVAAGANGQYLNNSALGIVPIALQGISSGTLTASASSVLLDGVERRVTLTLTGVKDAAGNPVPDGTTILASAANGAATLPPSGAYVLSYGGQIVGGSASPSGAQYKAFTITNGQVVFEYSTAGLAASTTVRTATVAILAAKPDGSLLSAIYTSQYAVATFPITLTVPGSAVIGLQPPEMHADGRQRLSQIVVSQLKDSNGNPLPDGAKVALTALNGAAASPPSGTYILSDGGSISTAGTTPGDGTVAANDANFKVFTIAGGEVHAVYSALGPTSLSTPVPGVNQTLTARVSVVPASGTGNVVTTTALATVPMLLRGTSSATASGPSTLNGAPGVVTFSAIKDSAGNTVPDGTLVAATAAAYATADAITGNGIPSVGGTITGGTTPPSGNYRLFTVTGGAVSMTYSTSGVMTPGQARVQIQPATSSGALIPTAGGNRSLVGGVWTIEVTP